MSNRFQEDVGAPTPPNKRKRIALVVLATLGLIATLVVAIKAGKTTKDPVRAVQVASEAARQDMADEANKGVTTKAGVLLNNDASVSDVGADAEKDIERRTTRKLEDAQQTAIDKEKKDLESQKAAKRKQQGLSLDPNGHPVDPELEAAAATTNADGSKKLPLPGYAEGWDPQRDIFVPAENGRPAFRYRPAYLSGSNAITNQEQMKKADDKWLDSMAKSSIGASAEADLKLNQSLKGTMGDQGNHPNNRVLRLGQGYQVEQGGDRAQVPCATTTDGTVVREVGPSFMIVPSSRHTARTKKKTAGGK